MEDVLDLYAEAATMPDPWRPLVCFDEQPLVLRSDAHAGQPCAPGRAARVGYEYVRKGTGCCLMAFAPIDGLRHVTVAEHRTWAEFAHAMQHLADMCYPDAEVIRVVLDNLSTHTAAALYKTFPPEEARRLALKLELHYTPIHASWLNMAELELAALTRQCLRRRLPDLSTAKREVAAWERERNYAGVGVTRRFTTAAARTKLARLYPKLS